MQRVLQVAKDFSQYGFPLTLAALLLTWYGDRHPPEPQPSSVAIEDLRLRVVALESSQTKIAAELTSINYSLQNLQKEFRISIRQVQRTSCVQLTAAQRKVAEACND